MSTEKRTKRTPEKPAELEDDTPIAAVPLGVTDVPVPDQPSAGDEPPTA